MNTRALKYLAGLPPEGPFRCTLPRGRTQDLEKVSKAPSAAIYLVDNADLAGFRTMIDLVVDRGMKNVHKGLKAYLTGSPAGKIPLVEGVYRSAGQLQRSVCDFLKRTGSGSMQLRAIVGVPPDLFDSLWTMAKTDPTGGDTAAPATGAAGVATQPPAAPETESVTAGDGSLIQLIGYHAEARGLESKFVGQSVEAELVRQLIVQAARAECAVLIVGDTGTGKNIVAQEIHSLSRRGRNRFVPVNCGAIPLNLLESEFFGYKKGAFTDAQADRIGLWEAANHGTIFLDEVAELPLPHQAKILR
ncbi:MAG TPA: sigma 54-interacting transcriptional regulator, partial [Acidobacteriota bacterium]|nr:sigma 54-interacting transcriptional regulator [Acidobacteriota bacterium]